MQPLAQDMRRHGKVLCHQHSFGAVHNTTAALTASNNHDAIYFVGEQDTKGLFVGGCGFYQAKLQCKIHCKIHCTSEAYKEHLLALAGAQQGGWAAPCPLSQLPGLAFAASTEPSRATTGKD